MVRVPAAILTAVSLLAIAAIPAMGLGTDDDALPGNGYVMMIHGPVEPSPTAPLRAPPAEQAVLTTDDEGEITLYAIPYSTDPVKPADVDNAELHVRGPNGTPVIDAEPEDDPGNHEICVEETSIETPEGNFSGPVEACKPFVFDADTFNGLDAVTIQLTFENETGPQTENYNLGAHLLLHLYMEGASPVTPAQADETLHERTPFLIESAEEL